MLFKPIHVRLYFFRYWIPTYHEHVSELLRTKCNKGDKVLSGDQRTVCENAKIRGFKNEPFNDSFTTHLWAASWHKEKKFSEKVFGKNHTISIREIVPDLLSVSERLNLRCKED